VIGVAATTVVTLVGAGTLAVGWPLYAAAGVLALTAGVRPVASELSDRRGAVNLERERAIQLVLTGSFVGLQEATAIPVRSLAIRAYRRLPARPGGIPQPIGQMAARVLSEHEQAAIQPLLMRCMDGGEKVVVDDHDTPVLMAVQMLDADGKAVGCILVEVPDPGALDDQKVRHIAEAAADAVWNAANIKTNG
jgi:hypothetical protein